MWTRGWQWWCECNGRKAGADTMVRMEKERVKKAKSRKTATEKAWLGYAVGQAWHGWPSGVAGPRKLGLHILPKLLPHISTLSATPLWVDERGAAGCVCRVWWAYAMYCGGRGCTRMV